jgi:hypothetical protein
MRRWVTAVAAIELPHPPETVLPAIWDIRNIERCEVKADRVDVHPDGARSGSYDVRGRFAGVPWRGRFQYDLDERGFHSRTADVPAADATVEGGFVVCPLGDSGSTVLHYEQYVLAWWLRPIALLVRGYLHWSMRRELRALRSVISDDVVRSPRRSRDGRADGGRTEPAHSRARPGSPASVGA